MKTVADSYTNAERLGCMTFVRGIKFRLRSRKEGDNRDGY